MSLILWVSRLGRKYRGDFIASVIAFLITFLTGWIIQGLDNIVTIFSLFGLIVVIIPTILSSNAVFDRIKINHIRTQFVFPINIGILNGYINEQNEGAPAQYRYTEFNLNDWRDHLRRNIECNIQYISANEISNQYNIILNPFGEMYPEINKANLTTLRSISDYLIEGGVFINVSGLAFYYSWDGEREDFSGPLLETYRINEETQILDRITVLGASHLLDCWLYNEYGIRTTIFNPKVIEVVSIQDEYFQDLDNVANQNNVREFRSAYRSDNRESKLIPLLRALYPIPSEENHEMHFECYPIAAVEHGLGYLVLNGMNLLRSRPSDFQKIITAISQIASKLAEQGTL